MSITINMRVESYDVQPNGNIKISSLLKMLQKAAGDDVNTTDLNYNNLSNHGIAFVLTKMTVQIIDNIKLYDELSIVSHPRKVRGASFPRDFIVYSNGNVVAKARSMWVLLDLNKRTILRPSAVDSIGYLAPSDEDSFEIADIRRVIDDNSLSRTDVRRVDYSFLDMNKHLNNTYYSDFIFNCIPADFHLSDKDMYIQINYKAEALFNDVIDIKYDSLEENSYDFIAVNKNNDKVCFTAYVCFCVE